MAPRAKPTGEAAEPTRRSTRISAQPKTEPVPVKEKKAAPTKKRPANEADGGDAPKDTPAIKKTKGQKSVGDEAIDDDEGADVDVPVLDTIDIGGSLPSFTLKNEKDEDVDVSTLADDKGVILFLVPKADTPGCTQQACGFRDSYPDFTSQNFDVYCLSADKPAAQSKWQTKKTLPYPLLSDPNRVLITALGAGEGGKTKRSHFIFEKGGKLVDKKIPVKPAESPSLALDFVKNLNG